MVPPYGLYARIDGCLSGMAGPQGLRRLAEAGSVDGLVQALRGHAAYAPFLAKVGDGGPGGLKADRTGVERALLPKPAADLLKLLPFTNAEPRNFLRALLRGFEVENLKRTLRRLMRPDAGAAAPFLYDLGTAASVPLRKLREAAAPGDLVQALAGTPFQRPLADALPTAEQQGTVFPFERALDHRQLASTWEAAGRLAGSDREGVRALLGTEADLLAILWSYRGRHLYGMRPDEMLPALPSFGRRLAPAARRALCEASDPASFAGLVASGPYASLLEDDRTIVPDFLEVRAARIKLAQAHAVRAGSRTHLGQVVAFLWLSDREVRDVGALAEGLHYGVDRATLARFVPGWPS